MEVEITGGMAPVDIGASGIAEIIQNVKTILSTIKGTVPLDRTFGISGEYVDKPPALAQALYTADIVDEVEKQESRVKVSQVLWDQDALAAMDGTLKPRVIIKIIGEY